MDLPGSLKRVVRRHLRRKTTVVKPSDRAETLATVLRSPRSLSAGIRQRVKAVTAQMRTDMTPHGGGRYETVAEHFAGASSNDAKLALLEQLVVYHSATSILEVGTAYGLSAITMSSSKVRPAVVTLDFFEPQATIGPRNIRLVGADNVECVTEDKTTALPRLAREGHRFDFVFHDGGHAGDQYVRDFETILPMLEPQSLYVLDDIAWDHSPSNREHTRRYSERTCFEGWQELLRHPKVSGAIMVGESMGVLLI